MRFESWASGGGNEEGYDRPHAVAAADLNGGGFSVAEDEPPVGIEQSDVLGGFPGVCCQLLSQRCQLLLRYPDPVIQDPDGDAFLLTAHPDLDGALALLFLDPVIDGVFHQGLENHFGNENFQGLVIHIPDDLKLVVIPDLLNVHIVLQIFQFHAEGNLFMAVTHGVGHDF